MGRHHLLGHTVFTPLLPRVRQFRSRVKPRCSLSAPKDLPLGIDRLKHLREPPDRLRRAEKQQALRAQRVVERGQQPPLGLPVEVDEQVPANDEVHLRKGRILDHALGREDQHLPELLPDLIRAVFTQEILFQPIFGHIGLDAGLVNALTGHTDRALGRDPCRTSAPGAASCAFPCTRARPWPPSMPLPRWHNPGSRPAACDLPVCL